MHRLEPRPRTTLVPVNGKAAGAELVCRFESIDAMRPVRERLRAQGFIGQPPRRARRSSGMARLACPQPPGVPLHLVLRGAVGDLRSAITSTGCAVHAYVSMATHLHLLVTASRHDGGSRLAERLGAHDLDATPVFARRYLLACMRYIELNPVRAGLVRHPADFRASSYRANALGEPDALVTPHAVYCGLGRDAEARRAAYRAGFRGVARIPGRRPAC